MGPRAPPTARPRVLGHELLRGACRQVRGGWSARTLRCVLPTRNALAARRAVLCVRHRPNGAVGGSGVVVGALSAHAGRDVALRALPPDDPRSGDHRAARRALADPHHVLRLLPVGDTRTRTPARIALD